MTASARAAWPGRALPSGTTLMSWLRQVHPWRWLRLLRNATLALIFVTGLLCLLVSYQAHREIATVTGDGASAITEVIAAGGAVDRAIGALHETAPDAGPLTGPPSGYVDNVASASKQLTLAAVHNVAGPAATNAATSPGQLLVAFDDQARQAVADFAEGNDKLANAEIGYTKTIGVQDSLTSLLRTERRAVSADLGSGWLSPGYFWWLLLAPFFAMVIVAAGTSRVLWRSFRRLLSVRLILAQAVTLALVIMVAALNVHDGGHARAFMAPFVHAGMHTPNLPAVGSGAADAGFAYSPLALAAGLALVALACALAYGAYRPRLAEYRYAEYRDQA